MNSKEQVNNATPERKCKNCGLKFEPRKKDHWFHDDVCRKAHWDKNHPRIPKDLLHDVIWVLEEVKKLGK